MMQHSKLHLFIVLIFALLITSACEKDNGTEPPTTAEVKKYNVSFKAQVFEQTVTPFKSEISYTLNDVKPNYTRIYNLDSGGTVVSYSSSGNTLPQGNYVAVFVNSNTFFSRVYGLGGTVEGSNFNDAFFDTRLSVAAQSGAINDIFYKKVYFTVSNKDLNQTVLLDRIVAGLEVVIEDQVPSTVSRLELTINDAAVFRFKTDSRDPGVNKIKNFSTTEKLSAFVLGLGARTVTIKAYNDAGAIIKEKQLNGTFYANKKTTFSGKLFTESVGFSASVNPEWDTPPSTIPF